MSDRQSSMGRRMTRDIRNPEQAITLPAHRELDERGRFVAAVTQGMAEAIAGHTVPHADAVRRLRRRFPRTSGGAPAPGGRRRKR